MTTTGWVGGELELHEMPASQHLRSVAEILAAPRTTFEERAAERRERAELQARRDHAADSAGMVEARMFMARARGDELGGSVGDVLARAGTDPVGRDRDEAMRRRTAIDLLRPYGLADVVTGGYSGVVIDANLGVLEPLPDRSVSRSQQAAQYQLERSQRTAEEGRRVVERARAKANEHYRSLSRSSSRSRVLTPEETYRRACAEMGVDPVEEAPAGHVSYRSADVSRYDAKVQRLLNLGYSLHAARAATIP